MRKTGFFKAFALVNFAGLITIFILYRNGMFNRPAYKNGNGPVASLNEGIFVLPGTDTFPPKKDSIMPQRLSSSKSIVIVDELPTRFNKPVADTAKVKATAAKRRLLAGTKSGVIVEPELFFKPDTTLKPQAQPAKKNKQ